MHDDCFGRAKGQLVAQIDLDPIRFISVLATTGNAAARNLTSTRMPNNTAANPTAGSLHLGAGDNLAPVIRSALSLRDLSMG
jgi:hypothetical protein